MGWTSIDMIKLKHATPARSLVDLWFLAYLLLGIAVYGLSVILMPLVVAAAGHRPFRIGAVVALQNTGLLAAPGIGLWMDRFGRHRFILLSGCLSIALGFLGLTLFVSLSALLASAFSIGLGTAAVTTATMVFTIERRHPGEWSGRIGYVQLFNSLGTTIGLATSGLLSLRAATITGIAVALTAAVLVRLTLPAQANASEAAEINETIEPDKLSNRRYPKRLVNLLLSWFSLTLGVACFSSPYPIIMHRVFDVSIGPSSGVLSIATLIGLPLYAGSSVLIRHFRSPSVLILGAMCRLVSLIVIALLAWLDPGKGHIALLIMIGLFQACWPIISVSVNDQLFRASTYGRGLAVGLLTFIGATASAAGALLGGVIADYDGYRAVVFAAALIVCLATMQFTWGYRREIFVAHEG